MRQLGKLPYRAIRRDDDASFEQRSRIPQGLDPDIRRLCREASYAINRYPVKDSLMFDEDDSDLAEESYEADDLDDASEKDDKTIATE